ncbi:hypothetical protein [Arcticibacterium luteifluviistationis]|uniref:hypothetical protein n=1 Tax=Arcticibacterium luteifluviistationis TaxID=1784714 RepID=UPI001E43D350|nr:hypothetical protein [Arcticibacterium luteifluviistationis]
MKKSIRRIDEGTAKLTDQFSKDEKEKTNNDKLDKKTAFIITFASSKLVCLTIPVKEL